MNGVLGKEESCKNEDDGKCMKTKQIKRLETTLSKCKNAGNRGGEHRTQMKLGHAYRNSGNLKEALECYKSCLEIAKEEGNKEHEVNACCEIGNTYHSLGDLETALDYHNQSLVGARSLENKPCEARVCFNLGNDYRDMGNFEHAVKYYKQSQSIAQEIGDRDAEGTACSALGNIYFRVSKFDKAIEYHKLSLDTAKENGNKEGEGRAYCNLGIACRNKGDFKQALKYLHPNLDFVKEAGDRVGECRAYGNLGDVYHCLSDFKEAINYHQRSLKVAVEEKFREAEGRAYGGLGIAYDCLGDIQQAVKYQKQSLGVAVKIKDNMGQRRVYSNLGVAYKHLGDFKKAIDCHIEVLRLTKELRDRAGEGRAYANLGNAYRNLGNTEQAIRYGKLHLEVSKEIANKAGEGSAYSNLGIAYRIIGNLKQALEFHKLHLDIAKEVGSKSAEGRAYCNLGNVYCSLGDIEKAMECYILRLNIAKEVQDRPGEGLVYGNFGNAYYLLGDYNQAIHYCKLELDIAREVGNKAAEARANYSYGMALEALGSLGDALNCYQASVKEFDGVRRLLQNKDEWKITLRNEYQEAYTALWSLLLRQNKISEALNAAEKGRAQALEDLLKSQYGIESTVPSTLEGDFSDIFVTASNVIYMAIQGNGINMWVMQDGKSAYFRRHTIDSKHLQANEVYDLPSLIDKTIKEIGHTASRRCEDRSLDNIDAWDADAPQKRSLEASVQLQESASHNTREKADVASESQSVCHGLLTVLHDITVTPIADLICGRELIIVPDGALFLAPFAAFLSPDSQYLCESFRLRVLPSLISLKLIMDSPPGYHISSGALVVGDPNVERIVKKKGRRVVKLLAQLPNAREEAEMIGRILNTVPLIGERATKEAVLNKLNTVAIIHIAAHGNSVTGEIALAPKSSSGSAIPEKEEYLLTMDEVLSVGLRARLVVLSCCHSGRGQIKAEGVVGIARAFLGAGARSVLVSLWAIDDKATLEFMRSFYQHLVAGKSSGEALNEAMKCLRESENYNAVKYWAPFVLIGDDVFLSYGENEKEPSGVSVTV